MNQKLTLRLEQALIVQAKQYAQAHGRSVSQLVADYFARLGATQTPASPEHGARTAGITGRLRGCLRGADLDEADYRQHLAEKYR